MAIFGELGEWVLVIPSCREIILELVFSLMCLRATRIIL